MPITLGFTGFTALFSLEDELENINNCPNQSYRSIGHKRSPAVKEFKDVHT